MNLGSGSVYRGGIGKWKLECDAEQRGYARFEFFLNSENQSAFRLATIIILLFLFVGLGESYIFIFIFKYQIR